MLRYPCNEFTREPPIDGLGEFQMKNTKYLKTLGKNWKWVAIILGSHAEAQGWPQQGLHPPLHPPEGQCSPSEWKMPLSQFSTWFLNCCCCYHPLAQGVATSFYWLSCENAPVWEVAFMVKIWSHSEARRMEVITHAVILLLTGYMLSPPCYWNLKWYSRYSGYRIWEACDKQRRDRIFTC